ncbi:pyridoxal phosphate-dependent aminotransferase [Candidatus Woesearchaeota archaeon]|nr:pyridoxal phosphate-dependent aminotransferase [Candidatus Woesearchaeota archaeon]
MLSQRVKGIAPSATLAIDAKAKQLKKEGRDVVIFGAGEPDFNTPENIKLAAKKAIDNNFTRYTPVGGIPELKKAVADKLRMENNIDYDVSEILVSCGGKHSLFNIAMAVLDKGDEAILPSPYWVSYEEMIKIAEANAVFCKTDDKFKLTAKMVEEKITPKTKMLILNSPSNPSGAIVEPAEIKKIADLATEHNFYVLSDEVYEHFIYGGKEHLSIASLNAEIKNLAITSNSVSKTYAMTGWRIGYTAGPKEIIKAMDNLQSHSTSNPSSIAQYAALEALNGPQDSVKQMVHAFDERRRFIHKRLNEIDGISCVEPEGAFYAFPDISETGMSSMEFASKLLDEALVAVVPGIAFGSDRHVRLSYATSIHEIERGLDRIEKWVKQKAVRMENEEEI